MPRIGWPKRLIDVKDGATCVTLRDMETLQIAVPAGTQGVLVRGSNWERFGFRTEPCKCCGIRAIINGVSWRDLRLTDSEA